MLTVPIRKDFTEYKPKVAFGLSMRTALCIVGALIVAVAMGVVLVGIVHLDPGVIAPLFWVPAMPLAAVGFVTPHGMAFEEFLPLWWRHRYGTHRIAYANPDAIAARDHLEERGRRAHDRKSRARKAYRKLERTGASELWSPGGELG